ncbi:MAG: adenylyl-sulfate kinase [Bacteroidales bacterium]|nr:adenylyl-sulfate kinase [Bacteroidales bacterium]
MANSYIASKISKEQKESRLQQTAKSIWMTGLSGAGKTTLGLALEKELFQRGFFIQLLDGDDVRTGLNRDLTYSEEGRTENIRRIAEVNALYNNSGIITISCFISPTNAIRYMARKIIGPENFIEVFVKAPLSLCEKRDVKGYYLKARQGLIKEFTGIDSPFEEPEHSDLVLETSSDTVEETIQRMIAFILPQIQYNKAKNPQ